MTATNAAAIDVSYVANLARLQLTPEETALFQSQLANTVSYVAQLQEVDISSVTNPAANDNFVNELRTDVPQESLSAEQALGNAPSKQEMGDSELFTIPMRTVE